jgi:hypothetical protein
MNSTVQRWERTKELLHQAMHAEARSVVAG